MTINEYLSKNNEEVVIRHIPCLVIWVNEYDDRDVAEKFPFNNDEKEMDFFDRKKDAIEELTDVINDLPDGCTASDVIRYFKNNTEDGNSNYWGGMLCVYTNYTDEELESLSKVYFGVRMD